MIRLNMIVEGLTEETFVRDVLAEYLCQFQIYPFVRQVMTGRKRIPGSDSKREFRGGLTAYSKVKFDIRQWIGQECKRHDVYFTTMFDLYALPNDFPGFQESKTVRPPESRVEALEKAFGDDINFPRFIPYIQLHEFEAIVLADPSRIEPQFEETGRAIRNLLELVKNTPPEEIDDGEQTSPSKRIIKEIPGYYGRKSSVGPMIVQAIGIPCIRAKCPHFNRWISKLEALSAKNGPG